MSAIIYEQSNYSLESSNIAAMCNKLTKLLFDNFIYANKHIIWTYVKIIRYLVLPDSLTSMF